VNYLKARGVVYNLEPGTSEFELQTNV